MANETGQGGALTPVGALLYAAHTAVAQRRYTEAKGREAELEREGRMRFGEHSRVLGTWTRYLSLSYRELERRAPQVAEQAHEVGLSLTPGATYEFVHGGSSRGDFINAMLRDDLVMRHKAQTGLVDLSTLDAVPADCPTATAHLLRAAALLLSPPTEDRPSPFDHDLRRLTDPTGRISGMQTEHRLAEADAQLDLAEGELEDAFVLDLSVIANRTRVTRADLEGLVREGLIPRNIEKNRLHANLGHARRLLGLPFLFMHSASPRIEGKMLFATGHVHFVRGVAPIDRGPPGDSVYLKFVPNSRSMRSHLGDYAHRRCRHEDLWIDIEMLSMWLRGWAAERFRRAIHLDDTWHVVVGHERPRTCAKCGGVQSAAILGLVKVLTARGSALLGADLRALVEGDDMSKDESDAIARWFEVDLDTLRIRPADVTAWPKEMAAPSSRPLEECLESAVALHRAARWQTKSEAWRTVDDDAAARLIAAYYRIGEQHHARDVLRYFERADERDKRRQT